MKFVIIFYIITKIIFYNEKHFLNLFLKYFTLKVLSNQFLLASPKGKPQFAQINGQIFDDPKEIIEQIETERNKKPQKVLEKSEKEIKMDKALDTMQM